MSCIFGCFGPKPPRSADLNAELTQKLSAIVNKPKVELEKEFEDLNKRLFQFMYEVKPPHIIFTSPTPFSASHCLDNTLILSQAPLTKEHLNPFFWMLYNYADRVVMLSQEHNHLPYFNEGEPLQTNFYSAKREHVQFCYSNIIESDLCITDTNKYSLRTIPHLHYPFWVDETGDKPEAIACLARMVTPDRKTVIHCKMGLGRSGTLAAVISAHRRIMAGDYSLDLIQKTVATLRCERPGCVSKIDQYTNIYAALKILLQGDGLIPLKE